ncbi:hypothetical protein CI109_101890 [Kwoniella shandongensis]|uniref:Uncharacterized protein n=1 Tax=Kwoniella shandongensis TaxID=1734106 RepID=A0A5M6BRZ2_9TREE|nr:uncharacterized protein CI109_006762 [Kwoniella shandongensis]KAA5524891.1 hypothetical protein CI109_006762 [Kwoniella shandongensis]
MIPSPRSTILLFIATQILSFAPQATASPSYQDSERDHVISAPVERTEVLGSATGLRKRADTAYTNPADNGGYMLTIVNGTYPAGLGEPLNVILSAESDALVLKQSVDNGGFLNYMLTAGLGEECLGQHLGSDQSANLGDGKGNVTEVEELRYNYGDPYIGTCQETFQGGLHLRYWIQNNTGAYFMAVSVEKSLTEGHDIVRDGYNIGRDQLVANLTGKAVETRNITNQTTFSGSGSYKNYTYQTDVKYVSGLLKNSSDDINHFYTVEQNGYPAIDGLVAVLTVKITDKPKSSSALTTLARMPVVALIGPLLIASVVALF